MGYKHDARELKFRCKVIEEEEEDGGGRDAVGCLPQPWQPGVGTELATTLAAALPPRQPLQPLSAAPLCQEQCDVQQRLGGQSRPGRVAEQRQRLERQGCRPEPVPDVRVAQVMNVTTISTKGRSHSNDYVNEY